MGHPQLLPFFYPLLTLYALARLFGDSSLGRRARAGYWLLAMAGVVAQLYAAVYLGWFLIVGLGLAAVVALAMPSCRGVLLEVVRRDAWAIAAAGAGGALLLQPFLAHYLPAAREIKSQDVTSAWRCFIPPYGPGSIPAPKLVLGLGGPFGVGPRSELLKDEHRLGIGFLTSIACVAGLYLGRNWPVCRLAAVVVFILWFATTYMPGNVLVMLAAGVCCYCAAGLFYEVDRPGWRGLGLAGVVGLLLVSRAPNPLVTVVGLTTSILCLLEIGRNREHPAGWIVPGIALLAISLKLFDIVAVLYGVMLVAPAAGLLAYYSRPRRREVGLGSLAFLMLFLIVITAADRPKLLIGELAAAPIALAASAPRRYRPPPWLLRE